MQPVRHRPVLSENRRRLGNDLHALAATSAGKNMRGLLMAAGTELLTETAASLAGTCIEPTSVFVVEGVELSDRGEFSWTTAVALDEVLASKIVVSLSERVARWSGSIGKPDMVGLTSQERDELAGHLRPLDPRVVVGRHGVRWLVTRWAVRSL